MNIKKYINETYKMNLDIFTNKLSLLNFGNASSYDRKSNMIFIKASGISKNSLSKKNIVYGTINKDYSLKKKNLCKFTESVDTKIHSYLYKKFKSINHIIHTHSTYATVCAQLSLQPLNFGTTHSDYFYDKIPLSKKIRLIGQNYEVQLAKSVESTIKKEKYFPPGILLNNHGALVWGKNSKETVERAIALEFICKLFYLSYLIKNKPNISDALKKFHYFRKNGKYAFYGQKKN